MQLINYGLQKDQNKIQRSHINKHKQFIIYLRQSHSITQVTLEPTL